MNGSRKIEVWFFVIISLIIFIYILVSEHKSKNILNDYQLLSKQDSISGIVRHKFDLTADGFRRSSNTSQVLIKDKKYNIVTDNRLNLNNLEFDDVLSVGDSIFKKGNNDSIIITKEDNQTYIFLLR